MPPLLSELSNSVLQLAVISGRDTDFLARHLSVPGLLLIGNHGLEERRYQASHLVDEAKPYARALQQATEALAAIEIVRTPGTVVEPKRGTLAVHYRQWRDPALAAARLRPALAALAAQTGLELREGRFVYELRPPLAIDKGSVLQRLVQRAHPQSVVYAGDDRTDVDAFSQLHRLRSDGLHTVAVAVRSQEAPAELLAAADLAVDGVGGVVGLLEDIRRAADA